MAELLQLLATLHELPSDELDSTFKILQRFLEAQSANQADKQSAQLARAILAHLPGATDALSCLRAQVG